MIICLLANYFICCRLRLMLIIVNVAVSRSASDSDSNDDEGETKYRSINFPRHLPHHKLITKSFIPQYQKIYNQIV